MNSALPNNTVAWYKQFWPWFLISFPASAVIAGFFMLWQALNSQHSMVVDDYFKYGKTINKRIERDVVAAKLGLAASLTPQAGELKMTITRSAPGASDWPESLQVRAVHPSDAQRDQTMQLSHESAGVYRALATLPPGRWQIHVEAPSRQWRLVSKMAPVEWGVPLRMKFREQLLPKQ